MPEVETRYGVLKVPNTDRDTIGRFLARYGEWAWDEICFVAGALPEDGARVLDGGAFVGTFGLGLTLRRRLGFLCLVEANKAVAPLLTDNVRCNCRIPAVVVEAMLTGHGARPTPGWSEPGNLGSMSFTLPPPCSEVALGLTAPKPQRVATLADLRAEHGEFDLVKLDVEGMELDILRADAEYLAGGGTTLWVECNEDPASLAIADLLLSWGLDLYYFAFPAHNPDNVRGDSVPIFPLAYEAGLLASPKVLPTLDDKLRAHRCILRPVRNVEELRDALWRTPRWGMPDWLGAGPEEMAALAGRALRGEGLDAYLAPGWSPAGAPGEVRLRLSAAEQTMETERERAETAEAALAHASAQLLDRLSDLGSERERAETAEAALAHASAKLLDRLSELGSERQRAAEAEAKVVDLERCHADLTARLTKVKTSLSWRLTAPLRHVSGALRRRSGNAIGKAIGRGKTKGKSKRGSWLRRRVHKAVRVLRLQATGHQQSSDKRQQRNRLAPWRRQLEAAAPPRQGAVHWVRLADHSPPMAAAMLVRALGATATGAGMIVSVSHDDYVRSYGGGAECDWR